MGLSEGPGETPGSLPPPLPHARALPRPPPRAPAGLRSLTLTCPCSGGQIPLGPVLGLGNPRNAFSVCLVHHLESG